jgi:ABC-2 type transport system ATP-binding protein
VEKLAGMSIISCENIEKYYPEGFSGRKKKILTDLSFTVRQGDVFGIVGPNGAGKSTTLKIILDFVRPDKGKASISGHPARSHTSHRHLGFLPENPSLYRHLTVTDHLLFAARTAGMPRGEAMRRADEILCTVDLSHAAHIPISRFSKGMTQRGALAYALFLKPEVLILDEPMSGLDPLGRQLVIDIIRESHQKGTTILFCSHILTDVERICTQIAIMDKGWLAAFTTPQELQQRKDVAKPEMSPLESFFLEVIAG